MYYVVGYLLLLLYTTSALPCQFLGSQKVFYDLDPFKKCVYGVAFNENIRKGTLETIRNTIPLYVFRDIIKDSPINGNIPHFKIDLERELRRIENTTYGSDWEFQSDVAKLFIKLKDPHTVYTKPSCYKTHVTQPLVFGSRLNNNNEQEIYIRGLSVTAQAQQYSGFPFLDWINATVIEIDDEPPINAILEYAKNYGLISKDINIAFNWVLSNIYQTRSLGIFPFPDSPTQNIILQTVDGIIYQQSIPWLIYTTNTVHYGNNTCHIDIKPFKRNIDIPQQFSIPAELNKIWLPDHIKQSPKNLIPIITTSSISIYSLTEDILVLKISTFAPYDNNEFLNVVDEALMMGAVKNIPYLILDVRGNGGGDICLGYQVIHRLVNESHPEGNYDIIHSNLAYLMISTATKLNLTEPDLTPNWWYDINGKPYTDMSWYQPGISHLRGGVRSNYSQKIHHSCNYTYWSDYYFKKIILLSDGTCGSTCAVFSSHLDEIDHVITVAMGGLLGGSMQYFSFPGGQVLPLFDLLEIIEQLNVSNSILAPPPFPTTTEFPTEAVFSVALLEIYPWLRSGPSELPLEFMYRPADERLEIWPNAQETEFEQEQLYLTAAKYLFE